jgi:transposase InsO family protein
MEPAPCGNSKSGCPSPKERLHGQHFETVRQAKDEALDWLLWYNQTRLHSTLNYVSPMQYEQNWRATRRPLQV